jgi:hypothetical protein
VVSNIQSKQAPIDSTESPHCRRRRIHVSNHSA